MFISTKTKSGVEIMLNPAHVASALHNDEECRVEICTGKVYSLPEKDWGAIQAALRKGEGNANLLD